MTSLSPHPQHARRTVFHPTPSQEHTTTSPLYSVPHSEPSSVSPLCWGLLPPSTATGAGASITSKSHICARMSYHETHTTSHRDNTTQHHATPHHTAEHQPGHHFTSIPDAASNVPTAKKFPCSPMDDPAGVKSSHASDSGNDGSMMSWWTYLNEYTA